MVGGEQDPAPAPAEEATATEAPATPKRTRRKAAAPVVEEAPAPEATDGAAPADPAAGNDDNAEADASRRGGWWQRTFGA